MRDRLYLLDKKIDCFFLILIGALCLFLSALCLWERIMLANTGLDPYRLDIVIGMYFFGLFGFMMLLRGLDML